MMDAYYTTEDVTLHLGDSLDVLPTLPDASVDAIVCDPPYALAELPTALVTEALTAWLTGDRAHIPATGRGFMGRDWDRFVPPPAVWDECLRVLKPGAHLAVFAGARTVDLMGLSMRLAGLEIRDSIDWIYGSGMPKGKHQLKPAHEPIILARKPLEGSITATINQHGTGGLNIDGCRLDTVSAGPHTTPQSSVDGRRGSMAGALQRVDYEGAAGRWPTNLLLSHSPLLDGDGQPVGDACANGCVDGCPVAGLDAQSGIRTSGKMCAGVERRNRNGWAGPMPSITGAETYGDRGGASRFFPVFRYEAKAPKSERPRLADGTAWPTVKPLALMRWLTRLITPPGGTVLDWCAGTSTTLEAARLEGLNAIGIERDPVAAELSLLRLDKPYMTDLFGGAA